MKYSKETKNRKIGSGVSIPAVTLAVFSSAVVMISLVLLVNYISGVVDRQAALEESVQVQLTEESAVAGLNMDLMNSNIRDFSDIPVYSLGGLDTSFRMVGTSAVPPLELTWRSQGSRILSALPVGKNIFVLSEYDNGLRIDLLTGTDVENSVEVLLIPEWNAEQYSIAGSSCSGSPVLFLLTRTLGREYVTIVSPETGSESYNVSLPFWNESSLLSAGCIGGKPALLISEGTNQAQLFIQDSLPLLTVSSPPGTTPVFYGQDQLYGSMDGSYTENGKYPIYSVLQDDFDENGSDDLLFIGSGSLSFVSEASGSFILDTLPGGRLLAWGLTERDMILSAKWIEGTSHERWRALTEEGFADSAGPEFHPFNWEGRLASSRNSIIGSIDGSIIIADENSEKLITVCNTQNAVLCELDGEDLDLIYTDNDLLTILLNPLDGDGLILTLRSVTYNDDTILSENIWNIQIYGNIHNRRVQYERAG
ncbi:MAG: hypothetical protein KAR44_08975 [Candidatus Aegiribacteria sp.]|nr:hypothetical protein [Candidatus Aegiribacteria sp.]